MGGKPFVRRTAAKFGTVRHHGLDFPATWEEEEILGLPRVS